MKKVKKHLDILGYPVKDKVTGFCGVAASVSFDLYGCVQVLVNPGVDENMKTREQVWFDIHRLELTNAHRVMDPPTFVVDPPPGPESCKPVSKA